MLSSKQTRKSSINESTNYKIKVELAVNINKKDDILKLKEALQTKGVNLVASDLEEKTVLIELDHETNIETTTLQRFIERNTGFVTVVKGLGQLSSAVAELCPSVQNVNFKQVFGILRLSQLTDGNCLFDGFIGGLDLTSESRDDSYFRLAIHEFGDLSGDRFEHIGELIVIVHEQTTYSNTISISKIIPNCDVTSMIGKSAAVSKRCKGEDITISAGVIARASAVASNKKQICSCSGKTLWEERQDIKLKKQIQE